MSKQLFFVKNKQITNIFVKIARSETEVAMYK